MKYFAAAALASMAAANPALLDNVLGNSLSDVVANADVVVPAGLELNLLLNGPKSPPPADRIYIWHPAHPGIAMDGCDAHDEDWHYVHPCEACQHGHHTWTTSTATNIVTKTVIDCAPTVLDCPARTTAITTVTTTICPATNTAVPTIDVPVPVSTNVPVTTNVPVPVTPTNIPVPVPSTQAPVTEAPCPETTAVPAPPPVWTTKAPMPPASIAPPHTNNTWTKPPVLVNGGAQAQVGIFAAVVAIVALL